ncbi:MAG: HAMP domain-containing histidine kinase, partial [Oscillospiraceae bacterium]|nr:HAMP domain-containing histidine kinase [Oscillospiraceae bacterium]
KNEAVFRFKEQRFKNEAIIYARTATNANSEKITILLNAQLSPVDATKEILQSQIKLIAVMLIAIALLLSKFAAAKLSNPIKEITNKAKRLANGDYNADYDGGGVYEIDQLAQALNFSAEGLSKVEELRRELVANVSHDLKTPLTMIKAYAEMIRDLTGDDKQRRDEQLEVIISESDRLTALVTDLIRTSREEQNKQYKKEQFSPKEMIENIAARFSQLHSDYTIITELQTDSMAIADRESIGQVLYNLISNAINYTGEDKTVKVDLFSVSDETLRIEISDSGKGIPPEELPLIWERYYRSKNTHQRPVAGTGLGLSIVKSALAGQNLKFGVMSEIEKGSTFWFELPTK